MANISCYDYAVHVRDGEDHVLLVYNWGEDLFHCIASGSSEEIFSLRDKYQRIADIVSQHLNELFESLDKEQEDIYKLQKKVLGFDVGCVSYEDTETDSVAREVFTIGYLRSKLSSSDYQKAIELHNFLTKKGAYVKPFSLYTDLYFVATKLPKIKVPSRVD
jgi:hypothetical protein